MLAEPHHSASATDLFFYLNGEPVRIANVNPTMLLVDYLRSPEVGLTGTKIGCKQGGCGACTVLLSEWDAATQTVKHRSVNSCMRPLAALDGMLVTTVEGTGSVTKAVSPVQNCLAKNNGTQCGFCTPGWVMNMTAAVAQKGNKPGTKKEIEGLFDGNLCRCTGYRPILYGFEKEFATDWTAKRDEQGCMTCVVDPAETVKVAKKVEIHFPAELKRPPRAVHYRGNGHEWNRPLHLKALLSLLKRHGPSGAVKLVVGNTSVGVYDKYTEDPRVLIDVAHVPELHEKLIGESEMRVGGAVTYSEFLALVDDAIRRVDPSPKKDPLKVSGLDAARYLAGRTAGTIVRNAASLAGNTMLVVRHNASGVPFPSDLFTALAMLGAEVRVICPGWNEAARLPILDFAHEYARSEEFQRGAVILGYLIPFRTGEICQTYKCALREVNAHSIVNAGLRVKLDDGKRVESATVVLGGIGTVAFHAKGAEAALRGRRWNASALAAGLRALKADVNGALRGSRRRWKEVAWEGFTDAYKRQLAESFFYKFFVHLLDVVAPNTVPTEIESAGKREERAVSRGTQHYNTRPAEYPVNRPFVKLEAFLQATGEAVYPQDIPLPRRGLEAALVTSLYPKAKAHFKFPGKQGGKATVAQVLQAAQRKFAGVVDIVTSADVPGQAKIGGGSDQPVFAMDRRSGPVTAHGQVLCMVLAETDVTAQDAAQFIRTECILYRRQAPTVTIRQAKQQHSIFPDQKVWPVHIWKITRPGSRPLWVNPPVRRLPAHLTLDRVRCKVVRGSQGTGGQIHFYMETQTCLAEPGEESQMILHPSSQSPDSMQDCVMKVLTPLTHPKGGKAGPKVEREPGERTMWLNKVDVRIKRIGGGYGGKCDQSQFAAAPAAVAAWKHQRPVRLASLRAVDTAVYGHRHPLLSEYAVAIGDGSDDSKHKGRLMGWRADFWLDGGFTYDCSFVVSDCLQLRCDSAYNVPNWRTSAEVCRTNKASNTAFRTMGLIQGLIAQEEALEAAAHAIGMPPEDVRSRNLYRDGDTTPFGQKLEHCYLRRVWDYTRQRADFDQRLAAANEFNRLNRWRKRGLSLIPVKYASGYNLTSLEQAGALIEVYDQDGSILVRHGGVDMGQGVNTKVAQIAALALNVSPGWVRIAEMDTAVVPNPVSTGASTGTAFNGRAVLSACQQLRRRLEDYCQSLRASKGEAWCKKQGIDYWDYPQEGWRTIATEANPPHNENSVWLNIIKQANTNRVNLSSQIRVAVPGGEATDDTAALTFHKNVQVPETVNQFVGFTYSAACAEVEMDVLTGETTVLRADIVYDMGQSLNPAIDVGQVEGGFIQGLGFVLYEELVYQPDGPFKGALNSLNTWEYKPPAVTSIPLEMNVNLFPYPRKLVDPNLLLSSKEVGEPPMCLAVTVFFAVKHAILAARKDRGHDEWFELECPATVQRIREACLVEARDLAV